MTDVLRLRDQQEPRLARRELLPDFIIVGAMRCGTTSLYYHLDAHPEICMARDKETDFFILEKNHGNGLDWYRSQFKRGYRCYGEASPNYSKGDVFSGVPERMHNLLPDVKLIYLVRDPVERFISHYRHTSLSRGRLPPIGELLTQHEGRHIRECGRYWPQISRFFEHFDPSQIMILSFEEFVGEPETTMRKLFGFIGVREKNLPSFALVANSTSELARLPRWMMQLNRSPLGRIIKSSGTWPAIRASKRWLGQAPQREIPAVTDSERKLLRSILSEDAVELRSATGLSFAEWSV